VPILKEVDGIQEKLTMLQLPFAPATAKHNTARTGRRSQNERRQGNAKGPQVDMPRTLPPPVAPVTEPLNHVSNSDIGRIIHSRVQSNNENEVIQRLHPAPNDLLVLISCPTIFSNVMKLSN
jgi:hypothetical protein